MLTIPPPPPPYPPPPLPLPMAASSSSSSSAGPMLTRIATGVSRKRKSKKRAAAPTTTSSSATTTTATKKTTIRPGAWSADELHRLLELTSSQKLTARQAAQRLGRSESSVQHKLHVVNESMRRIAEFRAFRRLDAPPPNAAAAAASASPQEPLGGSIKGLSRATRGAGILMAYIHRISFRESLTRLKLLSGKRRLEWYHEYVTSEREIAQRDGVAWSAVVAEATAHDEFLRKVGKWRKRLVFRGEVLRCPAQMYGDGADMYKAKLRQWQDKIREVPSWILLPKRTSKAPKLKWRKPPAALGCDFV